MLYHGLKNKKYFLDTTYFTISSIFFIKKHNIVFINNIKILKKWLFIKHTF